MRRVGGNQEQHFAEAFYRYLGGEGGRGSQAARASGGQEEQGRGENRGGGEGGRREGAEQQDGNEDPTRGQGLYMDGAVIDIAVTSLSISRRMWP
jgi:hypothetical protein